MKTATLLVAALAFIGASASAQEGYKKDIPESLAKDAKITESAAAQTAQKRMPKARIERVELEKSNGKLIYRYQLKTEGKVGMEDVDVSAISGKVIGVMHESAAMEKKETGTEKQK